MTTRTDPLAGAIEIMTINQGYSPEGTAPRELAAALVDLFDYTTGPEYEPTEELHGMLVRVAAAIVAVNKADLEELFPAEEPDDFRQGRDFANQAGVPCPPGSSRFALRTGPLDPARLDVYDEHGDRVAIATETHGGREWRICILTARNANTCDTVSFPRAIEKLDLALAEAAERP